MTPIKPSRLLALLLVLGGVFCIAFPLLAAVGTEIFVGVTLFFAAFFALFSIPYSSSGKWWGALLFLLYFIGGWILLANPLAGTVALATLVGAFMLVEGACSFALWWGLRRAASGWLVLVNGIATLVIGIALLSNPEASPVLLGLLIGLNLLFTGVAALAWARE